MQVRIKEFYVNGVQKDFAPFWIHQDGDLENDPYYTHVTQRMIGNYWILHMVDQNESDELIKSDQFVGPNMDARQIEVL